MATPGKNSAAEDFEHTPRQADQNSFRSHDYSEMTFSKSIFLAALSAISVFGADPGTLGVVRVQLRGQHLLVKAKLPAEGGAQLLQLQPHEDAAVSKRLALDWHLSDGIATTTIKRFDSGRLAKSAGLGTSSQSPGVRLSSRRPRASRDCNVSSTSTTRCTWG